MRSWSLRGSWGAFFAVEVGRVSHVEALDSTVAYFDSWSGVSGVVGGIFD